MGFDKWWEDFCRRPTNEVLTEHEKGVARYAWNAQQAKIDRLMMEHCPEDMTPEQIENWRRHQVASIDATSGEGEIR